MLYSRVDSPVDSSASLPSDGRVRVVVATTVLLTFISFWRAAAIVLADLGSTAFYVGGIVEQAKEIMHGKSSLIYHDGKGVFAGLPSPFSAIRYHSLIVRRNGLPDCLEITAWTDDGTVMGIRHRQYPVEGVQFHPESFMTQSGKDLLRNFLEWSSPPRK